MNRANEVLSREGINIGVDAVYGGWSGRGQGESATWRKASVAKLNFCVVMVFVCPFLFGGTLEKEFAFKIWRTSFYDIIGAMIH